MKRGLGYLGIGQEQQARLSHQEKVSKLKMHYGSLPLVIANIWFDLSHTKIKEAYLEEKEKSENGFKQFMIAHFFLWMYPKNVKLVRSWFNICLHYLQGSKLWCWSKKIAALKEKKIVWSSDLYSNDMAIIPLTGNHTAHRQSYRSQLTV